MVDEPAQIALLSCIDDFVFAAEEHRVGMQDALFLVLDIAAIPIPDPYDLTDVLFDESFGGKINLRPQTRPFSICLKNFHIRGPALLESPVLTVISAIGIDDTFCVSRTVDAV